MAGSRSRTPRIMLSLQHRHQHALNGREGDFAGSPRVLGILLPPTQLALCAQPWSTEPERCDGGEGEGKGQGWALERENNKKNKG